MVNGNGNEAGGQHKQVKLEENEEEEEMQGKGTKRQKPLDEEDDKVEIFDILEKRSHFEGTISI